MKQFSPSKLSLIKTLLIIIVGSIALYLILSAIFNWIVGVIAVIIIVFWYGYYMYRDYITFTVDNNKVVVSRFSKPIASYQRRETEFTTIYPAKKLLWLTINDNQKSITYDCDMLGKEQFLALLQSLAVPLKSKIK